MTARVVLAGTNGQPYHARMVLVDIHSAAVTVAGGMDSRQEHAGMTGQVGGFPTEIDTPDDSTRVYCTTTAPNETTRD